MKKVAILLIALLVPCMLFADGMDVNVVTRNQNQSSGFDTYPDGAIKLVLGKEIDVPGVGIILFKEKDLDDNRINLYLDILNTETSDVNYATNYSMTVTVDGRFKYNGKIYNRSRYSVSPLYSSVFNLYCDLPESVFTRFKSAPIVVDFKLHGRNFRYQWR